LRQRTIKYAITTEGVGLQTGRKTTLTLKNAPVDSGINFIRTDLPNKPLLNIKSINLSADAQRPERRTTLGVGPVQVQTTEHLLAALSGLSINNIVIECDGEELPGLDGSAKGFVNLIRQAGVMDQGTPQRVLTLKEPVSCRGKDCILMVFPDDNFRITYTLSYRDQAIGTQLFDIVLNEKAFEEEVAPARTFCLEEEAKALLRRGLGKGANYENTLVMSKAGPVKTRLRFPDEPVRHKVLDLIGDLYVLGVPIQAHVVAVKSGHRLNMELVEKLKKLI